MDNLREIEDMIAERKSKIKNTNLLEYIELLFVKNALLLDGKIDKIHENIIDIQKDIKNIKKHLEINNGKT